jgi:hypothetical protein
MKSTFKQFLESADPLEMLPIEIFFGKELSLSKEGATEAALWFLGHKGFQELSEHTWITIVDYVQDESIPDIYDKVGEPDHFEDLCHTYLKKVMKRKYGIKA